VCVFVCGHIILVNFSLVTPHTIFITTTTIIIIIIICFCFLQVVHTHTSNWLHALIEENGNFDFVVTRDGEGHKELIYNEGGAPRLNDATYVNTGILLFLNHHKPSPNSLAKSSTSDSSWNFQFLKAWWDKGSEEESYLFGRTYDQGALGHLFYTHGTPMRRRPPPAHIQLTPKQVEELAQEQENNLRKQTWRSHINVVEPEVMNNHAPGGSFERAKFQSDSKIWWCQHFKFPILQLSGQSNKVRSDVLSRIWQDGACYNRETTTDSVEIDPVGKVATGPSSCQYLEL
jgi:hypothetical protein